MNKIYATNWHQLKDEHIADLFDQNFGSHLQAAPDGTQVTVAPGIVLVGILRDMKTATIELLEIRSASTVYSICETGFVYQVCMDNRVLEYERFKNYQKTTPIDKMVKYYVTRRGAGAWINGCFVYESKHFNKMSFDLPAQKIAKVRRIKNTEVKKRKMLEERLKLFVNL